MSVTLAPTGAPANAPRANWANVNAAPIIALLGADAHYYGGQLEPAEVAPAVRRVLRALNVEDERASMRRPARESARVHEGGSTDAQARRRLSEALDVLRYAVEQGIGVWWG